MSFVSEEKHFDCLEQFVWLLVELWSVATEVNER